jgi:N-acetylmuramoyl-L-alanine amidase
MSDKLTRRTLIIGGVAFLAGCRARGSTESDVPMRPDRPTAGPLPPAGPMAPQGGLWYPVVAGDTFVGVSRRSGIPLGDLLAANPTVDARTLKPGSRLWLPNATPAQLQQVVATRPAPGQSDAGDGDDETALAGKGYVLVPRSTWTSQAVGPNHNMMNGVTRITVHHTGEHAGLADLPTVEVLRRIERYHREERKWCAIGYHYIIGHEGRVYEGRPAQYQGAHVLSENEHNLGISVAGDFMRKLPSPRQLGALKAFLDEARTTYAVGRARVFGHRDLNKSLCPGDALYAWLKDYKRG